MSAYDEECGCGEWSCRMCYGTDAVPGSTKNGHVDGHPPERDDAAPADSRTIARNAAEREAARRAMQRATSPAFAVGGLGRQPSPIERVVPDCASCGRRMARLAGWPECINEACPMYRKMIEPSDDERPHWAKSPQDDDATGKGAPDRPPLGKSPAWLNDVDEITEGWMHVPGGREALERVADRRDALRYRALRAAFDRREVAADHRHPSGGSEHFSTPWRLDEITDELRDRG